MKQNQEAVAIQALQKSVTDLSRWFERQARPLPWRATRDPYAIWISEVMLQQTQVTTVIPYYERFLTRFPNLEALAGAEESEVLAHWSGLGYYSRAKNLRKGAQVLVEKYRSRFPQDREQALSIPGIGPYTAGAVLSIAFDLPVPIVDGNVKRVLARYYALEIAIDKPKADRWFWEWAERWVNQSDSPRILNQAMMELGATVCIKGKPRCSLCPIASSCRAFETGKQEELPKRTPRKKTVEIYWSALVATSDEHYWLEKNRPGEWWSDLWDFPHRQVNAIEEAAEAFALPHNAQALSRQVHRVTHHKLTVAPYLVREKTAQYATGNEGRWWSKKELERAPISALAAKILRDLPG